MEIDADALLFDSDGVLVDSHSQVLKSWQRLAAEYSLDFTELVSRMIGVRSEDTLRDYVQPDDLAAVIARLEDIEVETSDQTKPILGSVELIDSLPSERTAFVTSASSRLALARWAGAGITPPPIVVTAEDVTHGKPDPEPFLTAAKKLSVDPARCVVFEDSPAGGQAAQAAGATVIAVGDQPWEANPVARIPNLAAVTVETGTTPIRLQIKTES